MKRLLTMIAALAVSVQAGYCAGQAWQDLGLAARTDVSAAVPDAPAKTMAAGTWNEILKTAREQANTPHAAPAPTAEDIRWKAILKAAKEKTDKTFRENYLVLMEDNCNNIRAELTAAASQKNGVTEFTVRNRKAPGESGDVVKILARGMDAPIEAKDASVGAPTPAQILARYSGAVEDLLAYGKFISANGQLTWTLPQGAAGKPSKMELAMIMFLVDEWFYFG